jgi:hypothetical protein
MKHILIIFILLSLLSGCTNQEESAIKEDTEEKGVDESQLLGLWIYKGFDNKLKKYGSFRAIHFGMQKERNSNLAYSKKKIMGIGASSIDFLEVGDSIELWAGSLTEGWRIPKSNYEIVYSSVSDSLAKGHYRIQVLNDSLLKMYFDGSECTFIRYSGSFSEYLNERIIAGIYVDSLGQYYEFKKDGTAKFPNMMFKYRIWDKLWDEVIEIREENGKKEEIAVISEIYSIEDYDLIQCTSNEKIDHRFPNRL